MDNPADYGDYLMSLERQAGYERGLRAALEAVRSRAGMPDFTSVHKRGLAAAVVAIERLLEEAKGDDDDGV